MPTSFPRRFLSAALLGAALLLLPLVGRAQTTRDVIEEAFKVRPGGTLYVDADHADLQVQSGRGSEVLIQVERIAFTSEREKAEALFSRNRVSFEPTDRGVSVRSSLSEGDSGWRRWRNRAEIEVRIRVQVPQQYSVDFRNGVGNVVARNLTGVLEGSTGAGNVRVEGVVGNTDLSTGSGNIDVSGVLGILNVETGAGNVNVRGVTARAEVSTGAGNITAAIVGPWDGSSYFHSGAGNVTVFIADKVPAQVDASAGIGSIETDFPLRVEGNFMSKAAAGDINGGGATLELHTGVGNVALRRL